MIFKKIKNKITMKKTKNTELSVIDKKTTIIQPNRITNTIFSGFTLIQHRVVTAIMLLLQEAVKESMKNKDYRQLNLFDSFQETLTIKLSLKEITKDTTAYGEIKEAIIRMSKIDVKIPEYNEKGKLYYIIGTLFTTKLPDKADYNSDIFIRIDKITAHYLIHINKDLFGNPTQFTKYTYEIAQKSNSIYSLLLYKFISSWKKKGGVSVAYNELRELLYIKSESYKEFRQFKKRILLPAQTELKEKADCWFNCNEAGFKTIKENNEGQKEIYLNFKIISKEQHETTLLKRKQCYNMLAEHFKFKDSDFEEISHILENEKIKVNKIFNKILEIAESISKNKNIISTKAYAKKAFLNHTWIKDKSKTPKKLGISPL